MDQLKDMLNFLCVRELQSLIFELGDTGIRWLQDYQISRFVRSIQNLGRMRNANENQSLFMNSKHGGKWDRVLEAVVCSF